MKKSLYFGVVPNKDYVNKDGTFTLRLRISTGTKKWYFPTGLSATQTDYEQACKKNAKGDAKALSGKMAKICEEAEKICDSMPVFEPKAFRKFYIKEATAQPTDNVFVAFQEYSQQLYKEGRVSSAKSYDGAALSFAAFVNGKLKEHKDSKTTGKKKETPTFPKLTFSDITADWLKRYSIAMEACGSSRSTTGIYCRSLRVIYNIAARKDATLRESYPFGKGKFEVPTSTKNKRALSKPEIDKIRSYAPETEAEALAKNVWLLSYLLNGANIADLVNLQYEQITTTESGVMVTFVREKTKRKAAQTTIKARIHPANIDLFQSIITQHGTGKNSGYVFPFMIGKDTPERQWSTKSQLIRRINLSLQQIGEKLELGKHLTTYTARHSFATILLRNNVPIGFISQALGHSDLKTTETYLGEFDEEQALKYSAAL